MNNFNIVICLFFPLLNKDILNVYFITNGILVSGDTLTNNIYMICSLIDFTI